MPKQLSEFDKRAGQVKKSVLANGGNVPTNAPEEGSGLLSASAIRENILIDFKQVVLQADSLRGGTKERRTIDYSLADIAKDRFGFGSADALYMALGINPSSHTLDSLSSMSDFNEGFRWLQPEVIREAIRLGLRRNPIYPSLIASEETVDQKKVTLPHINMSDATPEIINEGETIQVGSVSFGEKDVKLHKIGTGLQISDEVQKYVSLNILSMYLQDAGVKLGLGMDAMAVDVLINGDNGSSNFSAPVIGTENGSSIAYKDLLRAWLRMGRIGRTPSGLLSAEDAALEILLLDEFKGWSPNSNQTHKTLNIKTPIPQSQDYLLHGAMPSGPKLMLIDNKAALIKLNATSLQVESERIAQRQMSGTYATVTTGYAKLFRDACLILDGTQSFAGFPTFMDVSAAENVIIK
jgi:hypothetical protein